MRFEDMKNNIPETPEFIHVMIQNEVDRQLQGTTIIQIPKKRKKWNGARVAAAAMVCVLATSTAAYAGVKMYRMYVEKQGDYSVKTGITSENKLADLPAQIHDIDFKTGLYSGWHEMGRRVTSGISAKTNVWEDLVLRPYFWTMMI